MWRYQFESFVSNHHHLIFGVIKAYMVAVLRMQFDNLGTPVDAMDSFIAAKALAKNAILVTHSQQRVLGLVVDDLN